MNVFAHGDSDELYDMVASVMMTPKDAGENAVWVQYGLDFLKIYAPLLVWKRDHKGLDLDAATMRREANFETIIDAAFSPFTPKDLREALSEYLRGLSGYSDIKDMNESDEHFLIAKQQHGYRTMMLGKPLDYLGNRDY